jgi:hypothetical protein
MKGKYGRSRPYYGDISGDIRVLDSGPVALSSFTDGTGTSGYYDIPESLPAGALPLGWKITTTNAFSNDAAYTPADGTKIMFLQQGDADTIVDFTGATEYEPADGTTLAFTNTTNSTITDSAEGFVEAGLEDGDKIYISGSTSNDGVYTITSVAAGTLTFTGEVFVGAEAGVEGIRIQVIPTEATGGFVAAGFEAGDSLVITGSTSNDDTVAIVSVLSGEITLGDAALTAEEAGIEGVAFTTVSTGTVQLGVDGDTDRFTADTAQSVASTGIVGSMALVADAADGIGSAQTVRITVTEGSDFSEYDTGIIHAKLFYLM